jgi:hypothetical protein
VVLWVLVETRSDTWKVDSAVGPPAVAVADDHLSRP